MTVSATDCGIAWRTSGNCEDPSENVYPNCLGQIPAYRRLGFEETAMYLKRRLTR